MDSGAIITGLRTPTEREVNEMDPICMNDGKRLGVTLGICAGFRRVVAKLEKITRAPERGFFEVRPVPLLCSPNV